MASAKRPAILLDVDGTLCPLAGHLNGPPLPDSWPTWKQLRNQKIPERLAPIFYSPEMGQALGSLDADLFTLSSWYMAVQGWGLDKALKLSLEPLWIRLLSDGVMLPNAWAKEAGLNRWLDENPNRPFVWLDDEPKLLESGASRIPVGLPHLLICTDPAVAITPYHMEQIRAFLREIYRQGTEYDGIS